MGQSDVLPGTSAAPLVTVMGAKEEAAGQHRLIAGDRFVIASCGCATCEAQVVLRAAPGVWFRVVLRVFEDHWRLDNLSTAVEVVCRNLEGSDQYLRIPARRSGVPVPFEFAVLEFRQFDRRAADSVTVIGHEAATVREGTCCGSGLDAVAAAGLRAGTLYMAVLEALCGDHDRSGIPPSSCAIAAELASRGLRLSRRAVDHHVDYLFGRFFPEFRDVRGSPGWKRTAVAAAAQRARSLGIDITRAEGPSAEES